VSSSGLGRGPKEGGEGRRVITFAYGVPLLASKEGGTRDSGVLCGGGVVSRVLQKGGVVVARRDLKRFYIFSGSRRRTEGRPFFIPNHIQTTLERSRGGSQSSSCRADKFLEGGRNEDLPFKTAVHLGFTGMCPNEKSFSSPGGCRRWRKKRKGDWGRDWSLERKSKPRIDNATAGGGEKRGEGGRFQNKATRWLTCNDRGRGREDTRRRKRGRKERTSNFPEPVPWGRGGAQFKKRKRGIGYRYILGYRLIQERLSSETLKKRAGD